MNFDKTLRYIILAGLFFVPFIPFIVSNNMFFPFITGKNFTFRILTEVIFGSWIILALRNVAYRPRFSWLWVALAAFVGIIAIADLHGADPHKSIWSNYERMEGLVTLVHLLMFFFVIGTVLNAEKLWKWFLNTSVAASVLMGIYGLIQLSGHAVINQGGVRVDGKFGNATYLAVYMLFHIFITAILLLKWRGGVWMRYVYGAIIVLQVVILYHTATRGAILGLIGGILLAGILIALFERGRPVLRKVGISMFVAILLVVGVFFAVKDAQFVQDSPVLSRFAGISPDSGTVRTRFTIWSMAWEGVKERPILGWGQENFNLIFNKYYKPVLYADEPWFDRVHNIVFDWLVAGGVLGFLAYISIPLLLLYYIWFKKKEAFSVAEKSLLTGMLAGYMFHNLFVFDNLYSYVMYVVILGYVYAATKGEIKEESRFNREFDRGIVDRVALPLVVIAVIGSIYFVNTKGILACTTLIDALRAQQNPQDNITYFKEALAYNGFADQEIREQLIQAAARAARVDIDLEVKQEIFNLAGTEMGKQIDSAPDDARLVLFQGSLYDAFGEYQSAETYLERAHELSPNKQSISFALAGNLINLGRPGEAEKLLKETLELEPRYQEAKVMYATALFYNGKAAEANELLLDEFGTTTIDNNRLLQVYVNTENWEKVKEIWALRVDKNPNDRQTRLSLAASYLQLGDRKQAVAELETIIEMFPDFKDQGEYLIREIEAGRNP